MQQIAIEDCYWISNCRCIVFIPSVYLLVTAYKIMNRCEGRRNVWSCKRTDCLYKNAWFIYRMILWLWWDLHFYATEKLPSAPFELNDLSVPWLTKEDDIFHTLCSEKKHLLKMGGGGLFNHSIPTIFLLSINVLVWENAFNIIFLRK